MPTNLRAWDLISSKEVFAAEPWMRIIKDTIKLPNGKVVDDYYRIESPEYVLIYATNAKGDVLVERQYKHGIGKVTITFPAGFITDTETPLEAAQRELLEETGYQALVWKKMGTFVIDGTRGCGKVNCYLAEDLQLVAQPVKDDMEELEIRFLSLKEVMQGVERGDLCLLTAVAILALATNPHFTPFFTRRCD